MLLEPALGTTVEKVPSMKCSTQTVIIEGAFIQERNHEKHAPRRKTSLENGAIRVGPIYHSQGRIVDTEGRNHGENPQRDLLHAFK